MRYFKIGVVAVVPFLLLSACGPSAGTCDLYRRPAIEYRDQALAWMNQAAAIIRAGGGYDNPEYLRLKDAAEAAATLRDEAWDDYFERGCE